MERAEALDMLRIAPDAVGDEISDAYWRRARKLQHRAGDDLDAKTELERLNAAYTALAPKGVQKMPRAIAPSASTRAGVAVLDVLANWVADEALRTRQRWTGRNPEIALMGGAALVLIVLAIGAGASLIGTFGAAIVLCAAIWAPWRRVA